jgi:hypothetical protein
MSNSDFNKNVLDDLKTPDADGTDANNDGTIDTVTVSAFSAPDKLKNHFAWITLNSDGQITKIQPVYDNQSYAGNKDIGVTATRAIVASKPSGNKGLSFIPFEGDGVVSTSSTGWTASTAKNQILAINTTAKTAATDYAAYDTDVAFYTIDVRPNIPSATAGYAASDVSGLKLSVKEGPDGSYNVSTATASDILVSTISNTTDNNIYYVADLFFNNDGDIIGVYAYTQDVRYKSSDSNSSKNTGDDLVKDGTVSGKGTSGNPYTVTLKSGNTDCTISEALGLLGIDADVIANSKSLLSGTGNVEVGDTLYTADPADASSKVPDTNMDEDVDSLSFKLYVKDDDGYYWTITINYDYTLEEKAQAIVDELTAADDELSDAYAKLYNALKAYDDEFGTSYSDDFTAPVTASTVRLYAATSVLSSTQQTLVNNLNAALKNYNAAVTRYVKAVNAYVAADKSYKKANKDATSLIEDVLDEETSALPADATAGKEISASDVTSATAGTNKTIDDVLTAVAEAVEKAPENAEAADNNSGSTEKETLSGFAIKIGDATDALKAESDSSYKYVADNAGEVVVKLTADTGHTISKVNDGKKDVTAETDGSYKITASADAAVTVTITEKNSTTESDTHEYKLVISVKEAAKEETPSGFKITIGDKDLTPSGTKYTYEAETAGDVTFKLTADTGYTISTVKNGETGLTDKSGYTVAAEANKTVTVTITETKTGASDVTYTLEITVKAAQVS